MGDVVILAPPGRDDFDVLSGTGADVWELLGEPTTAPELVDVLARLYELLADDIANDVVGLIDTLLASRAIEVTEEVRRTDVSAR